MRKLKIRVSPVQNQILDPGIAVTNIMAFRLELESSGDFGDAAAFIVAAVDPRIGPAPYLVDRLILMHFLAIKVHSEHRFFHALAFFESRRAKNDVVRIPTPQTMIRIIWGLGFIDHRAHSVLGLFAIDNLNFIPILQVNPTVAARLHNQKLNVQPKIAMRSLSHNIRRAILAARRGWIIGADHRAFVQWILHHFPLDRQSGSEPRTLPISPLRIQHLPGAIDDHLSAGNWLCPNPDRLVGSHQTQGHATEQGKQGGKKNARQCYLHALILIAFETRYQAKCGTPRLESKAQLWDTWREKQPWLMVQISTALPPGNPWAVFGKEPDMQCHLVWHNNLVMDSKRTLGKRILLVDDEPEARFILNRLLSVDQHLVTEAANGKEACLLYAPGDFDLVITDYDMPEMKGDELARTLKCIMPTQRVIMITGLPWTLAGPTNPVDAVLIKPVTLDEVRDYISAVLAREPKHLPFRWSNSKSGKGIGLGLT